ncbi:restriction endonuclease subunit S [Microbulbifer agarilyticus]|uniref:restriction endonuclease subunit S n=1 Tax=Microbulbifer agarilyticus TaxID=260552 RepID=UPI001C957DB1|nr:restriction endonuclease subunit S [Microbulbifer agarilyticus]MBY6212368.1 restriction endonuclease subunit S [Microbulbifer agarilyticus]
MKETSLPRGVQETPLGQYPESWSVEPIGEIFEIFAGGDLRKAELSDVQTPQHPFPIFSNTLNKKGLYGYCSTFDSTGPAITVTARGGIGHAEFRDGKFCAIGRLLVLRPISNDDCEFFAAYLNNCVSFANESTGVPQLTAPQVAKYLVARPEFREQKKIANTIADIDSLLGCVGKLIVKKQAIKTATMQQLLTGKSRLPKFGKHPDGTLKGTKQSELGEIPEDWEIVRIGQEATLVTKGTTPTSIGRSFTPDGINFVKVESILESGELDETRFAYIDQSTNNLLARSKLQEHDILISIAGALGRAAVVNKKLLPANTNQALAVIRLKNNSKLFGDFLFHYTKSQAFKDKVEAIGVQGAQPNLSLADISGFPVVAPSTEEQAAIATILSDINKDIQTLEQRLNKIFEIKQGMMQQLLTSKIRLVEPETAPAHDTGE